MWQNSHFSDIKFQGYMPQRMLLKEEREALRGLLLRSSLQTELVLFPGRRGTPARGRSRAGRRGAAVYAAPLHYGQSLLKEYVFKEWRGDHETHALPECTFWIPVSQSVLELETQTLPLLSFLILKCVFLDGKNVLFFDL